MMSDWVFEIRLCKTCLAWELMKQFCTTHTAMLLASRSFRIPLVCLLLTLGIASEKYKIVLRKTSHSVNPIQNISLLAKKVLLKICLKPIKTWIFVSFHILRTYPISYFVEIPSYPLDSSLFSLVTGDIRNSAFKVSISVSVVLKRFLIVLYLIQN